MVEINRNQYFMVGIVILLLGLQFHAVDSFVLNEKTTHFLAKRTASAGSTQAIFASLAPGELTRKVVRPPDWLGWCLTSVGAILILHSFALPKRGG